MMSLTLRRNIFTNRNRKVRIVQALNHIGVAYLLLFTQLSPLLIGSVLVYFLMFCVGVNVGVHRYFSHNSFEASSASEWFMGVCMCLATLGSPLAWAGMHRAHHRFSDSPKDPHTPVEGSRVTFSSFVTTYIGLWREYIAVARSTFDLRHRTVHKFLHFYYLLVILTFIAILFFIKPIYVLYFYCLPAVLSFHAASLIVTVGHTFGSRPNATRDKSRNNVVLHWLTLGEGTHNQHHAFPNQYRYRNLPWYYFDLPGLVIETVFKKKKPQTELTHLN